MTDYNTGISLAVSGACRFDGKNGPTSIGVLFAVRHLGHGCDTPSTILAKTETHPSDLARIGVSLTQRMPVWRQETRLGSLQVTTPKRLAALARRADLRYNTASHVKSM